MSANRIAASTPSRSAAVTVTSVARPGSLQSSRNETLARTSRYSGMYRPACRISQTGVTSVGSRRQALRKGLSRQAGATVGALAMRGSIRGAGSGRGGRSGRHHTGEARSGGSPAAARSD